jgi:DNA-binding NarL/FixJ family response regulator
MGQSDIRKQTDPLTAPLATAGFEQGELNVNKVVLADDQDIFRAGVARILAMHDDFRIIAQCKNAAHLERAVDSYRGATVIAASALFARLSPAFVETAKACGRCFIVIAMTGENASALLAKGADSVLYRSSTGATLLECVRRVLRGERNILAEEIVPKVPEDPVGSRVRDRLTVKEIKILSLIMQGCKNGEVGARLGTSEQTIKNCLRIIFDKVGVSGRLELALFTIHHPTLAAAASMAAM